MEAKRSFGKTSKGEEASLYTLKNEYGMEVDITDYGATVVSIRLADGTDVALGYDDVTGYEQGGCNFGATIGRNANRIKDAKAIIGGKCYDLEVNDGPNNLHSSAGNGYHKRLWEVIEFEGDYLAMKLKSPHMDQGFPGNADIVVTFLINDGNGLQISYNAKADATTTFNLTNHSYFNLGGANGGSVLENKVMLLADTYAVVDDALIPTGERRDVSGTEFDFRQLKTIGVPFDHHFWLNKSKVESMGAIPGEMQEGQTMELAALLVDEKSGHKMEVYTDSIGLQMYTGYFLNDEPGKAGAKYPQFGGICFETQFAPNAINMQDVFESPEFESGERFIYTTLYRFGNL